MLNQKAVSKTKSIGAILMLFASMNISQLAVGAQPSGPLQGSVLEEDFRIRKPDKMRIGRQMTPESPAVDSSAFASPMSGKVDDTTLNGNAVQSADFARLPKGFDIGADKGSQELVLAWEKWHKQLAGAIYQVWNGRARTPGRAVLKITVYRNKIMVPEIISCTGDQSFRASIMSVFSDLNGNPGLTFPAKSERNQVSFEAEYIAGSNVDPGYTWLKGDYEKIKKDY